MEGTTEMKLLAAIKWPGFIFQLTVNNVGLKELTFYGFLSYIHSLLLARNYLCSVSLQETGRHEVKETTDQSYLGHKLVMTFGPVFRKEFSPSVSSSALRLK